MKIKQNGFPLVGRHSSAIYGSNEDQKRLFSVIIHANLLEIDRFLPQRAPLR
jgi:hypothetical protein